MLNRLHHQYPLQRGSHQTRIHGMCAMEMTAWLAGEEHSDEPNCTCPVIAAFVRALNDALPDADRTLMLRPLVPRMVNTRGCADVERQRGRVVADALARTLVPMWLTRLQRTGAAKHLRELSALVDQATAITALKAMRECAPEQHSALWVMERAAQGFLPARFVASAVKAAKEMGPEVVAACLPVLGKMVEVNATSRDLANLHW